MKPKTTPDYKRLLALFWEFASKLEAWHTLYLDSLAGYSILHERLLAKQEKVKQILGQDECAEIAFQDKCSVVYENLCGKDFVPISLSPVMKQGAVKARLQENGNNCLLLGAQCIVMAYSYWEEYLRIEIGIAMGILKKGADSKQARKILNKYVKSDFWGDLRILRNSIVHNNGKANSDMPKCKIIKCFAVGQQIQLTYEIMRKIFLMMGVYRNELHRMSFAPSEGMRVPKAENHFD